jgi:hypothetical protein
VVLHQNQEYSYSLRFERDDFVATDKKMSLAIEPEVAEFVNDSWLIRELNSLRAYFTARSRARFLKKVCFFSKRYGRRDFPRKNPRYSRRLICPTRIRFRHAAPNTFIRGEEDKLIDEEKHLQKPAAGWRNPAAYHQPGARE